MVEELWVGDKRWTNSASGTLSFRGIHWWPLPNINLSKDIPEVIADAFKEAVMALEANCPRASAVMSRRTLEAIAVDKGETNGALADRLAKLGSKGILVKERKYLNMPSISENAPTLHNTICRFPKPCVVGSSPIGRAIKAQAPPAIWGPFVFVGSPVQRAWRT